MKLKTPCWQHVLPRATRSTRDSVRARIAKFSLVSSSICKIITMIKIREASKLRLPRIFTHPSCPMTVNIEDKNGRGGWEEKREKERKEV